MMLLEGDTTYRYVSKILCIVQCLKEYVAHVLFFFLFFSAGGSLCLHACSSAPSTNLCSREIDDGWVVKRIPGTRHYMLLNIYATNRGY